VKGWLPIAGGLLAVVLGALWTLQGLGVVGGSAMSGVTFWAIVGPVVAIAGVVLIVRAMRARNAPKA
jgi:uncharacterized membrane protein HdeD (DUF308 family)